MVVHESGSNGVGHVASSSRRPRYVGAGGLRGSAGDVSLAGLLRAGGLRFRDFGRLVSSYEETRTEPRGVRLWASCPITTNRECHEVGSLRNAVDELMMSLRCWLGLEPKA